MTGSISAPRVGWLVDGFEETPLAVAMLLESSHGVELRIPTKGPIPSEENPYALWSLGSIVFHHDASWEMYSKRPNSIMQFCSVEAVIVLVGCQVVSATNKTGLGEIVVRADFAIHGARHLNYEKVNGIQTAIPSLSDWTQLKSAKYYPTTNEIGELRLRLYAHLGYTSHETFETQIARAYDYDYAANNQILANFARRYQR